MAQKQNREVARGAADPNVPPPYPKGTSSETIRKDIETTRSEMDQTVDALEERLRPKHLLDDLLDLFKGSTASASAGGATDKVKQAGTKVLDKLKDNPMPAALIGAGIAWLIFSDESKVRQAPRTGRHYEPAPEPPMYSGSYVDARTGEPYDASYGTKYRSGAAAAGAAQQAGQAAGGMAEKAKEKLGQAAESMKQKASEWTGAAGESAGGMGQGMREYSSAAGEQLHRGYDAGLHYVERGIEDYPLAMGAAAMAVGLLAGLMLPATRVEDKWMGEASDEVKDRAKQAGQSIASATAGAAEEGAQPGELAQKARNVAHDVVHAARESAHREGLDPQSLKERAQSTGERIKDAAAEEAQHQRDEQAR